MILDATCTILAVAISLRSSFAHSNGIDRMSRHLIAKDLLTIVAEAELTQGPFFEDEGYYGSNDLVAMGFAGSPGLTVDRSAVVDGVPLDLTVNVFDVSGDSDEALPYEGVEVFLWIADALGVYSGVTEERQGSGGGALGQQWLRGSQTTNSNGTVVFKAIMAGWYEGFFNRAIHYHIRFRLPGVEEDFAATTQLFIADDDLALYENIPPYTDNKQVITPLADDFFYKTLPAETAAMLVLGLDGNVTTGFSSTWNVGLRPTDLSAHNGEFNPGVVVEDAPGEDPLGEDTSSAVKESISSLFWFLPVLGVLAAR